MRHFGFRQNIPSGPINLDDAHKEDMRERMNKIWEEYHQRWIVTWNDQHNCIVNGIQFKKKMTICTTTVVPDMVYKPYYSLP